MLSPRSRVKKAAVIVFLLGVIVFFTLIITRFFQNPPYANTTRLSDGWNVEAGGFVYHNISLDNFKFPPIERGGKIILSKQLPEGSYKAPCLNFRVWHSTVDVSLDSDSIYTYGHENYDRNRTVGSAYHFILLPESYAGKILEIAMTTTETNAISAVDAPIIDSSENIWIDFITQNSQTSVLGIFLIITGIVILLFSICMIFFHKDFGQLIWISLLSITIGFWELGRYGILMFVSKDPVFSYWGEYMSLYLAPSLALMCLHTNDSEKQPLTFKLLLGLNIIYPLYCTVTQITGIKFLSENLLYCHLFIIIDCIYIAISCYRKRKSPAGKLKLMGIGLLSLFSMTDLGLYMITESGRHTDVGYSFSFAAFGTFILIIILLINYGLHSMQNFYAIAETKALEKLAYTDHLTGLDNRTRCSEIMHTLDASPETSCCIILFDLNNLKLTNDKLGHAAGDELISVFSRLLKECFSLLGTVARIGGDEFTVLITNPDPPQVENRFLQLQSKMDEYNDSQHVLHVSAAHGTAYRTGGSAYSTEQLYKLADERMYTMKRIMKKWDLASDQDIFVQTP